ncbi:gastrula zinc finger protein XlCGF67.1-like [Penaeus monodon]|uniref:gastrula zinc finger protein XlCGF67.1-like n=1 Tax=Penaeus monodon TaxID=6687 RepID=UPI0018A7926C|nr:gastrula zinc finger protein XlCGF67.1-like [Penaeus monodon]
MSFIVPQDPLTNEETFSTGVSIKEEPIDSVTEETCLDIKEEPLDCEDEMRDEVSDVKVKRECHIFQNLHDLRHKAKAKELCDLVQKCNDMLGVPFVVGKGKPYSCEICNKTFSVKSHLVRHMRVHTKEKPYSCEICSKAFTEKCTLIRHMRVHTKEKPYSCEICSKAFSHKQIMVRHMRIHTREKPFMK